MPAQVGIAVEVREPKGFGRCRMRVLSDVSAASLHPLRHYDHVEPGATVITDAWQALSLYPPIGNRRTSRSA